MTLSLPSADSTSSSPLGWSASPTEPDVFTRPLDTLETFFKILADGGADIRREHWAISLALRLKFPPSVSNPESYVRRTWLFLRKLHPHLGATAPPPGSGEESQRITIGPLDAEKCLSETFTDHSKDESGSTLDSNTMLSVSRPTTTAVCHWLPATQELYIRSSHWRVDGVGMMMLGYSYMHSLAAVMRRGLDVSLDEYLPLVGRGSLTPSADDMAKAYLTEDETPDFLREAADSLVASFVKGVPSIGLPTTVGSENALPGATFREAVALDESVTAKVIAVCKSRGISVSSAVHAALVLASATYPQHPLAHSYAAFFPTDLRRYLDTPWNSAEFAAGMFCSGLPVCVSGVKDKSFNEISRELNGVYSRDLSRMCLDEDNKPVSMLKLLAPYIRRTTKLFNTRLPPELPPVQNPDLSSLGVIDRYIHRDYSYGESEEDKIEVTGFWCGTEALVRSLQCHVWTFRGQLTIQACYNESFYERAFVLEVLRNTTEALMEGLGV